MPCHSAAIRGTFRFDNSDMEAIALKPIDVSSATSFDHIIPYLSCQL